MRALISTLLFAAIVVAGCRRPDSSVAPASSDGPKIEIEKRSLSDGRTLTRTEIASGPNPASDYDSVRDGEKAQATFSGGDGSSVEGAVVITASNEEKGNRARYIWLHERYPGSHLKREGYDYDEGGRHYYEITIVTADGKSRTVFFEITSFYGQ